MDILMLLCFSLCSIFIKSVESQDFCDETQKEKLVTGVMNYMDIYFLVFRENNIWSIEFNKSSREFLEPKLKQNLISN